MKYKIAIFDLDGTLLDTLQDLAISTNYALDSLGYEKRTTEEIRQFVGNGIEKLIEKAAPDNISANERKRILDCFKLHYANHCEDHTKPYEGMIELLDNLITKQLPIAVVSNKIDSAVQSLCQKYFGNRFIFTIGERKGIGRKPHPDSVLEVLAKANISPSDAVYIGDSEVDIITAKNAGTEMICVTWGFRDKDFLLESGAELFADSALQLEKLLFEKQ